jgi:hypothetical protein
MSSALQKFSGARSRWEDPEDFVSDVKSVIGTMARIYPMTEEEINLEHVSTLRRNLEGPAADWYYQLDRDPDRQQWSILKSEFLRAFQIDV